MNFYLPDNRKLPRQTTHQTQTNKAKENTKKRAKKVEAKIKRLHNHEDKNYFAKILATLSRTLFLSNGFII